MKKKADSPLETQINFAYRLSKSFSKPISLSEIARSSWQRRSEGVVTISFFEGKEVDSSDFAERIFKNITVLVTNCSGNIHTGEIIFHFHCDIMVSDRAGKYFFIWKLQGENVFQVVKFS